MQVAVDLNVNWFVQFIITTFIVGLGFGLHRFLKDTASKFFLFEDPINHSSSSSYSSLNSRKRGFYMAADATEPCAVCGKLTKKRCSRCKIISYCSEACQRSHWISEHKAKCNNLKLIRKTNSNQSTSTRHRSGETADIVHHSGKILFPYDEFVELFDWESPGFLPCGLLNCGNSCFANVVLQCLAFTKPLVAYLLMKGHRRECRRNDWCFLCEFQSHLERASQSSHPFSPINILSRLPNIGGNLGHGSQEDSHEFMRFAIDTMQSVCLDQFGGEKAVHPRSQETTLIQHIFGGQLQSQVICTKCNNISNQLENMMDLTVEIQGDVASLEECLDQFTVKESLHGENMYKCDRCNEYVAAWKRLSVHLPPNILTIALKRFQSGRFGKLNKRVTFPEKLDLDPYMSKAGGDNDIYELYAVIVHVDMLNASFFGHYICYVKDFRGQWYRIDDCKVARVDLDDVLSQGAYMLLYSRSRVQPRCMHPWEPNGADIKKEESSPAIEQSDVECPSVVPENLDVVGGSDCSEVTMTVSDGGENSSEVVVENMEDVDSGATTLVKNDFGVGVSDQGDKLAIAPSPNFELDINF
ncbi:cysteine protease [Lithospermum erythrorhizon]|uniref:Cysteine protease n=1 Tax=Lithospermum erythrorhizon TaxID=34254 RepID=A0AAV3S142_LITER